MPLHQDLLLLSKELVDRNPVAPVALQQARHLADYDTSVAITQAQAQTAVMRAELAFLDWETVKTDPAAATFLTELLYRGIPKR